MRNVTLVRFGRSRNASLVARGRPLFMALLVLALLLLGSPQAGAINIVMNFNSGASAYPDYDPDGSKLVTMMSYVEGYYQDIFEASGTLNVEFYYANIDSLAVHNNTGTSGGKPTSCRIRLDTNRTWFFDETPLDNSEFNMTQYLYRDLNATQKADYYNGSPPNFLEYAYKGNDNGTGPAESINGYDVWSILLHEMGHGLGMTGNVAFWEAWWDEEYDVDPDLVWGASMAVPSYSSDDIYHVAGRSNMYPYSSVGQRVLPSATDIFAIETCADWGDTTIDLFRQDFYSTNTNGDFNNNNNWEGHQVPGSADDVWIRHGRDAHLTADIRVNNLVVDEGVTIYTGAYRLYADQNCTLGNGTNYARVYVQNGGEFQVDLTLRINANAQVQMASGSLLDVDSLLIMAGGELIGAGTVDIEDDLNNHGRITVSGGDLVIDSDVTVNLDGSGANDGEVYVTGGNFSCNKALTDSFSGTFQVNNGYSVTFTEGWRIDSVAQLTMYNGSSLHGGLFRAAGTVNIDNDVSYHCDVRFESTADVNLPTAAEDLYLYGDVIVNAGASIAGGGEFRVQEGAVCTFDDGASTDCITLIFGETVIDADGIGQATVNGPFGCYSTAAQVTIEADGDQSCDVLAVNGNAILGGTLYLDFIDSYVPDDGDTFTVLTYTSRSGTFDAIEWSDPSITLSATYGATGLTLTAFGGDASMAAVPEPGTLVLLLGGMLGLGLIQRRRK
ncbi:MAG: PEP-CTERM sorting domain-containing protein [Pirellulales bacterium]|nr:PEP-CTERM sorting domain-containing protein [Pirellulales bacterium]